RYREHDVTALGQVLIATSVLARGIIYGRRTLGDRSASCTCPRGGCVPGVDGLAAAAAVQAALQSGASSQRAAPKAACSSRPLQAAVLIWQRLPGSFGLVTHSLTVPNLA